MSDHLDWLLTKLRNAESLNDYYAKRIAELEAKPAVDVPSPWRTGLPDDGVNVLVHLAEDWRFESGDWQYVAGTFDLAGPCVLRQGRRPIPFSSIVAWMPIQECDK